MGIPWVLRRLLATLLAVLTIGGGLPLLRFLHAGDLVACGLPIAPLLLALDPGILAPDVGEVALALALRQRSRSWRAASRATALITCPSPLRLAIPIPDSDHKFELSMADAVSSIRFRTGNGPAGSARSFSRASGAFADPVR